MCALQTWTTFFFLNNRESFVFFFSVKFGMTATSFAALRDAAMANRSITVLLIFESSPCPLTSRSPSNSSYRFLHSYVGFWLIPCRDSDAHTLLVCHHNLEVSSLSVGLCDRAEGVCTAVHNIHTFVVAFLPESNH